MVEVEYHVNIRQAVIVYAHYKKCQQKKINSSTDFLFILSVLAIVATREPHVQPIMERQTKGETSPLRLIAFLTLVRLLVVTGVGTLFIFFNVYMDAGLHISTVHIGVPSAIGRLLSIPTALIVPLLTAR